MTGMQAESEPTQIPNGTDMDPTDPGTWTKEGSDGGSVAVESLIAMTMW